MHNPFPLLSHLLLSLTWSMLLQDHAPKLHQQFLLYLWMASFCSFRFLDRRHTHPHTLSLWGILPKISLSNSENILEFWLLGAVEKEKLFISCPYDPFFFPLQLGEQIKIQEKKKHRTVSQFLNWRSWLLSFWWCAFYRFEMVKKDFMVLGAWAL